MGEVSNTVLWLHTVCGYCMHCVLNERLCISLCLSVHSHSLLRSGTVHILHYNLPPALSQWWYSQHFALYYDLYFSHIPPISSQRHHWVPEHLFSPHGYTWVPTLSLAKTGFQAITCAVLVEKSQFHLFQPDSNQTSHFLSFSSLFLLVCSGLNPEGGRGPSLCQSVCFLYAYDCHAVHLKPR